MPIHSRDVNGSSDSCWTAGALSELNGVQQRMVAPIFEVFIESKLPPGFGRLIDFTVDLPKSAYDSLSLFTNQIMALGASQLPAGAEIVGFLRISPGTSDHSNFEPRYFRSHTSIRKDLQTVRLT
jgi:hypothetical protein